MADAQVLGTCGAIRKGSSPFVPTRQRSEQERCLYQRNIDTGIVVFLRRLYNHLCRIANSKQ